MVVDNSTSNNERIILSVKIPDLGITKKILFDRIDNIKDAIDLIIEKLPPGSLDLKQNFYNIYLPQKGKWCKLDSTFSKYKFKENQEIELKKDTRSGVTHILSSMGNLMRPYRTVYIKLPDIMQTGMLDQSASSAPSTSPQLSSSSQGIPPPMGGGASNSSTPPSSLGRSSGSLKGSQEIGLSQSTPITGIPKLNLSNISPSVSQSSPQLSSSPSSSPRLGPPPLEQKKSLLKIFTGNIGSISKSADAVSTSPRSNTPTNITPRNMGTFSKSSEESVKPEEFDFDDDITLREVLSKIYQKYQHIDKDLLEDYGLVQLDGTWLVDKSKTLPELGVKHMESLEFKRKTHKVKVIFLNRELLLQLNPYDTLKEINYKITSQYLPSLIKLHRSSTVSGPSGSKSPLRSSLSMEPINLLLLEQNYLDLNSSSTGDSRSSRSYSDASPLSFSGNSKDLVLPQQQVVENMLTKRKSSIGSKEQMYRKESRSNSTTEKPTSLQLGYQQLYANLPQELQEFKDFKLHLTPRYNNPLIANRYELCLDEKRTLQSFNLWNNVKLYFKSSLTTRDSGAVGGHYTEKKDALSKSILKSSNNQNRVSVPFYLIVESEAFSVSCVITVENTSTVHDVIKAFNRFLLTLAASEGGTMINDSLDEYALYFDTVDSTGGKREGFEYSGGLIYLDSNKPLAHYPIEPLDRLVYQRTNKFFGIEPSAMPCRTDPTLNLPIPAFLIDLKTKFIKIGGMSVENLFRVNNNSESAFQTIANALAEDTLLQDDTPNGANLDDRLIDAHSIISFIKRWFMKLPKKLCQEIDEEALASVNETNAEQVLESISLQYRSLLMWLVRFLAEIVQNSPINKSSAKNLAVSVGSILVPYASMTSSSDSSVSSSSSKSSRSIKQSLEHSVSIPSLDRLSHANMFLQHLMRLKLKSLGVSNSQWSTTGSFSTSNNSCSEAIMTGSDTSSLLSSSLISRSPSLTDINNSDTIIDS